MVHCTCAANVTKDSKNREESKRDSANHVFSVLGVFSADITNQNVFLFCQLKVDIYVSHVLELLKSFSALITAESMFVLCSCCLAHYQKHKLNFVLAMV